MLENEQTTTQEASAGFNPFAQQSWSEALPEVKQEDSNTTTATETSTDTVTEKLAATATETIPVLTDYNSYLKEKFGFESEEEALKQIEELKTKSKEKTFANDFSKTAYDYLVSGDEDKVYEVLSERRKIKKFSNSDLSDANIAAEVVKYSIAKNKDLTPDEVEFLFNKRFALPKEPVQSDLETDEEFQIKHNEWKSRVLDINKEMIIEAKLAKPDIEKLNNELILSPIQNGESNQPSQEDLQKAEETSRIFSQKVDESYKSFNGFETRYKDEEVEIPVSFSYDDVQKASLKEEIKKLNVSDFLTSRWFGQDGEPNVTEIMSDVALLKDKQAILNKVANEVGSQVLKHYRKTKANVEVSGGGGNSELSKAAPPMNPFATSSWSESPRVGVN
jgi:hypothetical protein